MLSKFFEKNSDCTYTFFKVVEGPWEKYVEYIGYGYFTEGVPSCRFLHYKDLVIPVEMVQREGFYKIESDAACEVKQYLHDCGEQELEAIISTINKGKEPLPAHQEDLDKLEIGKVYYLVA